MHKIQALLIGAPVASFLFLVTLATTVAVFQNASLFQRFELKPYTFVHERKRFTVLTSGLIHANWQHLFFNMLTFYFFAFTLERMFVMRQAVWIPVDDTDGQLFAEIIGRSKFFVFYLACMVIAVVTTIIKYKDDPSYRAVGASGALSGVVIGYIILAPSLSMHVMIFGVVPGWLFALLYVGGSYVLGRMQPRSGIAHEAHLWGSLAGLILTVVMFPKESWMFVESVTGWWELMRG